MDCPFEKGFWRFANFYSDRRPVKLPDVYLRPPLDGKRVPGEVEIHQNDSAICHRFAMSTWMCFSAM